MKVSKVDWCIARFVTDRLRYRWRSGTTGSHWRGWGVASTAAHARHRTGRDARCSCTLDRMGFGMGEGAAAVGRLREIARERMPYFVVAVRVLL